MRGNRICKGPEQGENLTCVQGTENGQSLWSILREKKWGSEKTLDNTGPCRPQPGLQISSYVTKEAMRGINAQNDMV